MNKNIRNNRKKTPLKKELVFYEQKKPELLAQHKGKYVLIKKEKIIDIFPTFEKAFAAGMKKFGNVPFLIKHIQEKNDIVHAPALTVGVISARIQ